MKSRAGDKHLTFCKAGSHIFNFLFNFIVS
jgi:hypothetical protein